MCAGVVEHPELDLDQEVDSDFGQDWLAINNQEVAMAAGVFEHLDRPMAVESAVDSGFLVDTSPGLPLLLASICHNQMEGCTASFGWGHFWVKSNLQKYLRFLASFSHSYHPIDTWGGE